MVTEHPVVAVAAATDPLLNVTRAALWAVVNGIPGERYPALANLINLSGGVVGTKYHTRKFVELAQHRSFGIMRAMVKDLLSAPLSGLGIAPDFEFICYGGSLGKYYSRGGDTLLFVGVTYSCATWPYTGTFLVGLENEGGDARASANVAKIKQAFNNAGMSWQDVLPRLAIACGDGAFVKGGPAAKHSSTNALGFIWSPERTPRVIWDCFHRVDAAGSAALHESRVLGAFFDLCKRMEHLIGLGQGRHLARCVANYLGEGAALSCKSPIGSRKLHYLTEVPLRFLDRYKQSYYILMGRMRQGLEGRGSKSFKELKHIGEQFCNVTMLTFVMGLGAM